MKRRGYLMVEAMAVISLSAIFVIAASQTFVAAVHMMRDARAAEDDVTRYAALTRRLHADVWSASAIAVPNERTAVLSYADGREIVWTLPEATGPIQRAADGATTDESILGKLSVPLVFAAEGPCLVVRPAERSVTIQERRMVSQVLLARGGER
jgi:hypothetical protein